MTWGDFQNSNQSSYNITSEYHQQLSLIYDCAATLNHNCLATSQKGSSPPYYPKQEPKIPESHQDTTTRDIATTESRGTHFPITSLNRRDQITQPIPFHVVRDRRA